MIQRVVVVKFHDQWSSPQGRAEAAAYTHEVFAKIPGIKGYQVGLPADEHCHQAWDMCLTVQFDDVAAVEAYAVEPTHHRYVHEWLIPRAAARKAWNFDLNSAPTSGESLS